MSELHALSVAIGEMRSDIKNVARDVQELKEETTTEHRKVHDIVVASSEATRNLTRRIEAVEPFADAYRKKLDEDRGADRFKSYLYGLAATAGGLIVFVLGKITEWYAAIFTARPHP